MCESEPSVLLEPESLPDPEPESGGMDQKLLWEAGGRKPQEAGGRKPQVKPGLNLGLTLGLTNIEV